ncbi:hypothetical protein BGX30_006201, partial [Mortierella sp. GBA39]
MQAASLGMNIGSVLNWISQYYWLYLSGSLFFFFVLLVCAMIIPNVYTGALIAFIVCVVLGIANYEKLSTTGEPLFPWDLMQIKNAQEMTKITKGMISPTAVVVSVLLVAALIYLMLKLPKVKVRLPLRITLGIISLVAVGGFIQMVGGQHALATSLKYQNIPWNQKVNYAQNGFVYAFAGNLMQNLIEKPEGYSKEAIEAIAQKYGASTGTPPTKAVEQPNIMYMMDEAFFDPTRMPSYTFSEDPLKFIHQNAQSTPDGFLLSPEFGGNTANVEFEALTGLSMYFLKDGSIPEKDLPNAKRYTPNGYISDMAAVQEAVRELKSASKPTFLHLVTMQNHFPFTKGLNGSNTITVSGVKPEYKDELETYTHDTKLTDEAVAYLSQQLKTIQRPTIVAFWGDHLPALSSGVYAQAGFNDNPRLKHETKLIYLANFDIGSKSPGTMSPAFIGPTVFELSGQSMPAYYKLLEKVKSEIPGLNKS